MKSGAMRCATLLMRKSDTHFVFDVGPRKSQTEENPVFYVQMAHRG